MKLKVYFLCFFSFCLLLLSSCASNSTNNNVQLNMKDNSIKLSSKESSAPLRDCEPVVLIPQASAKTVFQNELVSIDASNVTEGYIMVNYKGKNSKVKLQITGPNTITYTYTLHGGYETFPLSSGDGSYSVSVFENVNGDQYSTAFSESVSVSGMSEFGPYLYPNQYVNFTSSSKTVLKGKELASTAHNDLEVVSNVYNYIISNISYDYDKANTVQSGYIPDVDNVLQQKTGICFDYASVMACMLRSQGIPTRLEVGYAADAYHAWISTYIKDVGWVNGIIQFDGKSWQLMDPTFAANTNEKKLKEFIGNGSNYVTKYVY